MYLICNMCDSQEFRNSKARGKSHVRKGSPTLKKSVIGAGGRPALRSLLAYVTVPKVFYPRYIAISSTILPLLSIRSILRSRDLL